MKLFAFVLLATLSIDAGAKQAPTVEIVKFAFAPKEITVAPGTTIVWTNHDETPHTIIASDGTFVSKAMDTDDHFEYTFAKEGDFSYFCTLHPYMTGFVHVRR
jgi:plastocyanin